MIILGVDVGGTFTDLIVADLDTNRIATHKVSSTSPDPSEGVEAGIRELCRREAIPLASIDHLFHGTTVATNAMLEHRGALTGMITTRGFRDILHIGRHQRPQNYSIMQDIPWQSTPLVERQHRKVVSERMIPPHGDVLIPLDEAEVLAAIRELQAEGVKAIAVCFLFSYLDPSHELRVKKMVEAEAPEIFVTTSSGVSAHFREFERFTTACMNAFLGPEVKSFISLLDERLKRAGVKAEMHIMTSNGGVATPRTITETPVHALVSGLAGGVLGGQWVGGQADRRKLITFDVGGTSADIGIVTEHGILQASPRDTSIAGFPVMTPMIDVYTIGAGGGSIAYVDAGGAFKVGPRSAGSSPGPAAYGLGGTEPTVTDANIVLGRIDPDHFLGGSMRIFPEASIKAVERLAAQLGLDIYEAAEGICTILASNMANAIRSRTVQKGLDPRAFTLIAFGGAGPMTAIDVANMMKIPEVIIPVFPGITSALGLLTTDLRYEFTKTQFRMLGTEVHASLNSTLLELRGQAERQLRLDEVSEERISFLYSAEIRYAGQGYEMRVPLGSAEPDWDEIQNDFHTRHTAEYGHGFPQHAVEVVVLRVMGIGAMPRLPSAFNLPTCANLEHSRIKSGETYFRHNGSVQKFKTEFFRRADIPAGSVIEGPAILFQKDSTTVVAPGWTGTVDKYLNILLTRQIASPGAQSQQGGTRVDL